MNKAIIVAAGLLSSLLICNAQAASSCPTVAQLHYSGGTQGMINPPSGWAVTEVPTSTGDLTPSKWVETSWQAYHGTPDLGQRITCFYDYKGDDSPHGLWGITREQTSADPWSMPNRASGWVDQDSHKEHPLQAWDFCQDNTGGSIESCTFPLT
jgi:hypothetical protein